MSKSQEAKDKGNEPDVLGMVNLTQIADTLGLIRDTLQSGHIVNASFFLGSLYSAIINTIEQSRGVED
jgi:hypothetical protein